MNGQGAEVAAAEAARPSLAALSRPEQDLTPAGRLTLAFGAALRAVVLITAATMLRLDTHGPVTPWVANLALAVTVAYVVVSSLAGASRFHGHRTSLMWTSLDILLISWLVWLTGGLQSDYYLLYYLPILHAGLVLRLRDALSAAILAVTCYAFVATLQRFDFQLQIPAYSRLLTFAASGALLATIVEISARRLLNYQAVTKQLDRALATLSAAYEVAKTADPQRGVPSLQHRLVTELGKLIPGSFVFLLVRPDDSSFNTAAAHPEDLGSALKVLPDFPTATALYDRARATAALRHTHSETVNAVHNDRWGLSIAVTRPRRVFGIIQILSATQPTLIAHPKDLVRICDAAALVWENLEFRDQVQQLSTRDSLTGLWNRPGLETLLDAEVHRSCRYHLPLTLALFDLQDFQGLNQRLGPKTGDGVLRAFADHLRTHTRTEDQIARLGNDEFLVVLAQTALEGAQVLVRRVVDEWATETPAPGAARIRPAVRVGVVALRDTPETKDDLIRRALQALDLAKRVAPNGIYLDKTVKRGTLPTREDEIEVVHVVQED